MFDEKHTERKLFVDNYYIEKQHLKKTPQFIFDELPNLWNLLQEKNLAPEGMTYQIFVQEVHNSFIIAQLTR